MSLLGRLRRWLSGDGGEDMDEAAGAKTTGASWNADGTTTGRPSSSSPPSTSTSPSSPPSASSPDPAGASVPEAEPASPESTDGPSVKCTVCGTVADAGTAACPLCGSTDVRPVTSAADAVDTGPGRDVTALVEEAESTAESPVTRDGETSPADAEREPEPERSDESDGSGSVVDETPPPEGESDRTPTDEPDSGSTTGNDEGDDDEDVPSGADAEPRFAGRGPARTRSDRADDDAVSRLQELKRRETDDGDANGDRDV